MKIQNPSQVKSPGYIKLEKLATSSSGNKSNFQQSEAGQARASVVSRIFGFIKSIGSRIFGQCASSEPRAAGRTARKQKQINSISFAKEFNSLKIETTLGETPNIPAFKEQLHQLLGNCKGEAMIDMEGMPPTCRDAALETIAAMDLINAPTLALRNIECTAGGNDYHQLNKFLESPVARNRVTDLKLTVRAPADLKDSVTAQNFSIPLGNIEKLKNLDISLSHELCGHINFARTERIIASVSLNFFGSDKKKSGGMYRANYEAGLASDLPKADKINLKGKVFDLHAIPIYVYHNPHVKEINLINSRESGSSDSIYTDLWLETSIERMTVKITKTWKPNEFGYEYRPRTGGNNLFGNPNRASHKIKVSVSDTVS